MYTSLDSQVKGSFTKRSNCRLFAYYVKGGFTERQRHEGCGGGVRDGGAVVECGFENKRPN